MSSRSTSSESLPFDAERAPPARGAGRRGLRRSRDHRRPPRHLAAPLRRRGRPLRRVRARARHTDIAERHAEIKGEWHVPDRLHARSARPTASTCASDGTLEILDFKTGAIPTPGEMKDFMAPQLLLEAKMARARRLPRRRAARRPRRSPTSRSARARRPTGPTTFRLRDGHDLQATIDEAWHAAAGHVDALLLRTRCRWRARVIPDAKQRFRGEFDHLARTEEWLVQEDEDFI